MTQETVPQLLQNGVTSAKAGDKVQARRWFGQVIEIDPNHEVAWIWLAGIAETPQEAGVYLERVLEINPGNERARAGLKWVQSRLPSVEQQGEGASPSPIPTTAKKTEPPPIPSPTGRGQGEGPSPTPASIPAEKAEPTPVPLPPGRGQGEGSSPAPAPTPAEKTNPTPIPPPPVRGQGEGSAPTAKPPAKLAQRGTILVVDDSPTVRKLVAMTLERDGYRVMVAANGVEALSEIQDHIPVLIFLDISMPRMDGYQLCKLIRGDQATKNIPVILLSGKDGFFDKVKGRLAGSTEYITKPFEPETLLDVVAKYLS